MNNTLYEITDKYLKVLDNLEIDEETGEILNAEELDELSGAFEEKSEAVACYIKNSEVFIGDLKAEEANLAKRRKQTEKRIDYLKNVLTACLDAAGRDKVETTKVRVSFRKSVAATVNRKNIWYNIIVDLRVHPPIDIGYRKTFLRERLFCTRIQRKYRKSERKV